MTFREFLHNLRKTPRRWAILNSVIIQEEPYANRPIEAVFRKIFWFEAPLRPHVLHRVMTATHEENRCRKTRKDLLRACGLEESK